MLNKSDQLKWNKKPKPSQKNKAKTSQSDREYLSWLQNQSYPCFVCGTTSGIEYHHITDIHRIKGKRREHNRLVPLCFSCHRTGKNAIHNLSKEDYYKNIKSLDELLAKAKEIYEEFLDEK